MEETEPDRDTLAPRGKAGPEASTVGKVGDREGSQCFVQGKRQESYLEEGAF